MILPIFYRLFGYRPISDGLHSAHVARSARLEVRAAVGGLVRDVQKLISVISTK